MNQYSDDRMDLDSPASYGTRSVGRRHASLPSRFVGNVSRLEITDRVIEEEDTSPSTDRSSGSITVTSTPSYGSRSVPRTPSYGSRSLPRASLFLTRNQAPGQAKEHSDTSFEKP
ncbi:hypothetical protein TWF481_009615 [Arthrobotrys musiformis]|uniref:Uncharacterized protein n=1 Tax=Arthrobotrys musiformis TaxID=47236 RepID=A0AAV9W697_9PEZI